MGRRYPDVYLLPSPVVQVHGRHSDPCQPHGHYNVQLFAGEMKEKTKQKGLIIMKRDRTGDTSVGRNSLRSVVCPAYLVVKIASVAPFEFPKMFISSTAFGFSPSIVLPSLGLEQFFFFFSSSISLNCLCFPGFL